MKAPESYNKNNHDDENTSSKCNSLLQSNLINADNSQQFSLKSFNNNVILLLGGLDRGHSFDPLNPYLKNVK